ncbi:MAG: CarD family transcriptional regulator [Oribacterium sp.]|nr:CarD family transcriptional regulator [Oribacterium sp.]
MFQPGEYVVYGCKGIHRIMDITTLDMDGVSKDKKYYVMQPCGKQEGSVYAPVDAQKINMRLVMTKAEAEAFLSTIDSIAPLDIKSNKQREEAYKECIRSCDPDELMRVIKTLYRRKQSRKAAGKKLTLTDLHYLTQAETILYTELSLALDKSLEEMPDYIQSLVDQELVK